MYKFIKISSDWRSSSVPLETITIEAHDNTDLSDILDMFRRFLLASGWDIEGALVCEEQKSETEEQASDGLHDELYRVLTTVDHPELTHLRRYYAQYYGTEALLIDSESKDSEVLHDE